MRYEANSHEASNAAIDHLRTLRLQAVAKLGRMQALNVHASALAALKNLLKTYEDYTPYTFPGPDPAICASVEKHERLQYARSLGVGLSDPIRGDDLLAPIWTGIMARGGPSIDIGTVGFVCHDRTEEGALSQLLTRVSAMFLSVDPSNEVVEGLRTWWLKHCPRDTPQEHVDQILQEQRDIALTKLERLLTNAPQV